MSSHRKRCEGAALIESCIVIILLCLILFGMLQVSLVTAAHDINVYAASCGTRCAAVGYTYTGEDSMVYKAIRVAALPNLGPRPGTDFSIERLEVENYLLTEDSPALDYENWDTLEHSLNMGGDKVRVNLVQDYPLSIPFVRAIYPGYEVVLDSDDVEMMNHAALYLE